MTGHNEEKSPEAQRKEAERLRDLEMGIERKELKLSATERALLDEARALRGGYSVTEYLATLVRKDHALVVAELDKIKAERCERCGVELPGGCLSGSDRESKGLGQLQGEAGCWRTYNALRLHL